MKEAKRASLLAGMMLFGLSTSSMVLLHTSLPSAALAMENDELDVDKIDVDGTDDDETEDEFKGQESDEEGEEEDVVHCQPVRFFTDLSKPIVYGLCAVLVGVQLYFYYEYKCSQSPMTN